LSIAELKIKSLEVELEYVKMESLNWVENARFSNSGNKIKEIQYKIDFIINGLEDNNS
jgi:hypothetical protein